MPKSLSYQWRVRCAVRTRLRRSSSARYDPKPVSVAQELKRPYRTPPKACEVFYAHRGKYVVYTQDKFAKWKLQRRHAPAVAAESLSLSLSLSVSRDVFELSVIWCRGCLIICLVWVNDSGVFVSRCILLFSASLSVVVRCVAALKQSRLPP